MSSTMRSNLTLFPALADKSSPNIKETFIAELEAAILTVNRTQDQQSGIWYYADYYREHAAAIKPEYENGYADPKFWVRTSPYVYEVKKKVLPSVALKAFLQGFTIADCGSVIVACQYAALLSVLGEKKFNDIFSSPRVPLKISQFIFAPANPIAYFFHNTNEPPARGDMCYIEGISHYSNKHPRGHARGWSVLCTGTNIDGETVYLGFGPQDFLHPASEKQIQKIFLYYYNLPRDKLSSQWIAKHAKPEQYDLTLQNIPETLNLATTEKVIQGYETNSTVSPDFTKINRFVKTQLTAREFIADYDNFLIQNGCPATTSRPDFSSVVLPVNYSNKGSLDNEDNNTLRVGIPRLCS